MLNVEYRKGTAADREKFIDFANMVFSCAHQPHNFKTLIPKVYADGRDSNHFHNIAVREDGCIRGMVAVMPNELTVAGTTLKTGYVGTVSTHPYGRGEGHMKKLMAMAIDGMQAEGVDMTMLGGQRQRYEYFGFTRGGIARSHRITKTNLRHVLGNTDVSNICIREVAEDNAATIAKCAALNEGRKTYAKRTAEDFCIISKTWNKKLMAVNVDGGFAGYIIASGGDFAEILLYDVTMVIKVIKAYVEKAGVDSVNFSTGDYEVELNRELAKVEEDSGINHSEMLRIFNFPKVIGALMSLKASYKPMMDGKKSFLIDGKPMTIVVDGGVPTVNAEAAEDATELTAKEAQTLFLNLNGEEYVQRLPMGWAPLPLYMSHTDGF